MATLAGLRTAEAYTAPTRKVTLTMTEARESHEPYCDVINQFAFVSVNGGSPILQNVPLSANGKNGPDAVLTALAGGIPVCPIPWQVGPNPIWPTETFVNGPTAFKDDLACNGDTVYDFEIDMKEEDGGVLSQRAKHSWSVDIADPNAQLTGCHDEGADGGMFCWEIKVEETHDETTDTDGDGLPDLEEIQGVDHVCDGVLNPGDDLFLHQMGVSVNHKDMLVQMNWYTGYEPAATELEELKAIFARAPIDAGGSANPDGTPGIHLIIDAGTVMNDVGVHSDAGQDLGSASLAPGSSADLEAYMATFEPQNRIGRFRHLLFGPMLKNGAPATEYSALSVGDDRMMFQSRSAGTMLHELGHSLGLLHGGELRHSESEEGHGYPAFTLLEATDLNGDGMIPADVNGDGIADAMAKDGNGDGLFEELDRYRAGQNCKPNHISRMNYLYSGCGIPFYTNGRTNFFDDLSPSLIPNERIVVSAEASVACPANTFGCNRRLPLLERIDEATLDETKPFFQANYAAGFLPRQQLQYYGADGKLKKSLGLDVSTDWDGDPSTTLMSFAGQPDVDPNATGSQQCTPTANAPMTKLDNLDEWSRIVLPLERSALGAGKAVDQYFEELLPSDDEVSADCLGWLRTDLSLSYALTPQPIVEGATHTLAVNVLNRGPNPASDGFVDVTFPEGTTVSFPPMCEQLDAVHFRCTTGVDHDIELFPLPAGQRAQMVFGVTFGPNTTGNARNILISGGHEGEELSPFDNSIVVPVLTQPAFLGIESAARKWVKAFPTGTAIPTTTSPVSEGSKALALPCNNTQFESPLFNTYELETVGTKVKVDVYVPTGVNPSYVGDLQMYLDVPAAGLSQSWIGRADFATLQTGRWSTVEFTLTTQQKNVLLADYAGARFRFASNVALCSRTIVIDNLRFGGTMTVRRLYHPSNRRSIVSSSVLTFDEAADWAVTGGSGTATRQTNPRNQGTASFGVTPGSWLRLESRAFAAGELSQLTNKFSLDVRVPSSLPPSWVGQVSLFASCPSSHLYNAYLGAQALQVLFGGEFNQLNFTLPPNVMSALQSGGGTCRFAVEMTAATGVGAFALDNGGFAP